MKHGRLSSLKATPAQRTPWRWVALSAFCASLLGCLVFAPARWLVPLVEHASQGRVQLRNAQGTLWQGQGDLVLHGGAGSQSALALPGGIRWQAQPHLLWPWQWSGQVHAPCCTPEPWPWQAHWTGTGLRLALPAHQSTWPLPWLNGLGTPWNTVQLQGQLQLQTAGLNIDWSPQTLSPQGELTLRALDVGSRLSTLRTVGSYQLRLESPAGQPPKLALTTLQGDLVLQGEGDWSAGHFRFRGWAESHPDRVDALSNLLNLLGQRDGLRARLSLG